MKALIARLKASRAYRSWQRYGDSRGNLLAGGVAYLGFFSILPALALGFTVFGFVLRGQPELFSRVVDYVSSTLPGVIRDSQHPDGIIDASSPPTPNALSITGAVSVIVLLVSGLGWIDALRKAVRAVFDKPVTTTNPVLLKLRDLATLATLGLALLASAALSFVVNALGANLLGWVGFDRESTTSQVVLRVLGAIIVLGADFVLMMIVLRVMSGIQLAREDVAQGALVGAVGLGILKLASGLLVQGASNKPLLAGFAVIVGLLVLLNLISRVILVSAAWTVTTIEDARQRDAVRGPVQPPEGLPRPAGPRDPVLPSFGTRSADRTALAAGAVLGVTVAVVARTARRGLRAAVGAARGR